LFCEKQAADRRVAELDSNREKQQLQYENRILKKGVAIQDAKLKEKEHENGTLAQMVHMSAYQIQQLEQVNLQLRAQLANCSSSPAEFLRQFPPGVH